MATPHVAGIVALIKEMDNGLTPKEIKDIIINSAEDINYDIFSQGAGIINLERAYTQIINHTNSVSPSILNLVIENGTSALVNLSSLMVSPKVIGLHDGFTEKIYSQGTFVS